MRVFAFAFGSVIVVGMALRIAGVLIDAPTSFAPHLRQKFISNLCVVIVHGAFGCLALGLGVFQFIKPLRHRYPRMHRTIGTIYLTSVSISGTTGLLMAMMAFGGPIAAVGFATLAILWLGTGIQSVLSLVRHDYARHGQWMMRNYALTFSAVMVRVWLSLTYRLELPMVESYMVSAWISWVPTVVALEVFLRRRPSQNSRRSQSIMQVGISRTA